MFRSSRLSRSASLATVSALIGSTFVAAFIATAPSASAAAAPAAPVPSISHYVRDLTTDVDANRKLMSGHGCDDVKKNSHYTVLDIGAQTIHAPLSKYNAGVLLTGTLDTRLDYPTLNLAIEAYLDGYYGCGSPTASLVLQVATNNDGEFVQYAPKFKGQDWANRVVEPVQAYAAAHHYTSAAVRGAIDIEAGFTGTFAQSNTWELNYFASTPTPLTYVGSADGCPSTVTGVHTNTVCKTKVGAVTKTWTQAQYYVLAHQVGTRLLPQVYVAAQARQWANIDVTGGKGLRYAGVLTEHAACPTSGTGCPTGGSLGPSTAWRTLQAVLATIGKPSPDPASTDLQIDAA